MTHADEWPTSLYMSVLMTPDMSNFSGKVHGGALLKLLDQVSYACASKYAKSSRPVPPLTPRDPVAKRRYRDAQQRRAASRDPNPMHSRGLAGGDPGE